MQKIEINRAVRGGIAYIAAQQLENGGFKSFSSPSKESLRPQTIYQTTFVPSLTLGAIAATESHGVSVLRAKLATFLKNEAGPAGAYNYWASEEAQCKKMPYPDDLDDTFCALAALYLDNPANITEAKLAQAVKLLLAAESAVGGPYRTWLVSQRAESIWQDVDLAVNANIAYFLSLVSNPLPKLQSYIDEAISKNVLVSPYYPSAYPIAYYIARGYSGSKKTQLIKIIRNLLGNASSPQDTALCLAALASLKAIKQSDEPIIKSLLSAQAKDGSWPAAAFCLDPSRNGRSHYHGSPVLTTAFVIQTLTAYLEMDRGEQAVGRATKHKNEYAEVVMKLVHKRAKALPEDLRQTTVKTLQKLADSSNGAEIVGLAPRFNTSLQKPLTKTSRNFLLSLSLGNLYGWLAYTVYDDFIDEEGSPGLLPAANVTLRDSVNIFMEALPENPSFRTLVQSTFDTIDGANAWELAHCRFGLDGQTVIIGNLPDFKDLSKLAERSLGHGLAPLAILAHAGHATTSMAFRQTKLAFNHYLIAKQLCDDMHDWQEDLQRGHCTYVVARLLEDLGIRTGRHNLSDLLRQGQRKFWHDTLPSLCREAERHVALSRKAIGKAAVFKPNDILSELLENIEFTLNDTVQKQTAAKNFLQHYDQNKAEA
ncbi:MAG TPA: hypothetical protein VHB72_03505 [Candidatus Saccharimonadales bacterium]|nr:hypothetical protein [Candidatus Saccharimonadales bacterium]